MIPRSTVPEEYLSRDGSVSLFFSDLTAPLLPGTGVGPELLAFVGSQYSIVLLR